MKELAVLRGLERLRPEWDTVLDGTEKALYQNGETAYQAICEEFHRTWGAAGERRAEWENIGEQLLMFSSTPISAAPSMTIWSVPKWNSRCSLSVGFRKSWLHGMAGNGKTLSMHDIEELSWRYAREVEHSDDNLNALEDWLFETYAPEGAYWKRNSPDIRGVPCTFSPICAGIKILYRKKRGKNSRRSSFCRLPQSYLASAAERTWASEKIFFDFSAIVISLAIGLIGAGRPVGIGIGTVIAMVCTGRVITAFNHFAKKKIEEITIA